MESPTLTEIALPAIFLVLALKLALFPPPLNQSLLKTRSDQIRLSVVMFVASVATAMKVLFL